ncbi:MAG TPA: hypothetical protein PKA00_07005 [Saprospiraceae bacterium]|nr:hypothetical protein [Saprospiraceae bacterium]HMQ82637.1 hypothetical protein [Saprospiraceae bacterium]
MLPRFFPILLMATLISACAKFSEQQIQEQEDAWDQMMVVHDEVMPKLGDMNQISRALNPYLDEGILEDKALKEEINLILKNLETAEDGMMEWMAAIGQNPIDVLRESKSHDEIMAYIAQETEAIGKVKDQILSSIQNGQIMLARLESDQAETAVE